MDRQGQHVAPRVEDALCAIAVVQVHVQNGHPAARRAQTLCGDGRIVQIAEAARKLGKSMVPRRAAQRIGAARPAQHQIGCMQGGPGAGQRRAPGLRRDGAGGVGHVKPGLSDGGFGVPCVAAVGVDIGNDLCRCAFDALPAGIDRLQEGQVAVGMHGTHRVHVQARRLNHRQRHAPHGPQQRIDPRRLFRAGLRRAGGQEILRIMGALGVVKNGDHASPRAASPAPSSSSMS